MRSPERKASHVALAARHRAMKWTPVGRADRMWAVESAWNLRKLHRAILRGEEYKRALSWANKQLKAIRERYIKAREALSTRAFWKEAA